VAASSDPLELREKKKVLRLDDHTMPRKSRNRKPASQPPQSFCDAETANQHRMVQELMHSPCLCDHRCGNASYRVFTPKLAATNEAAQVQCSHITSLYIKLLAPVYPLCCASGCAFKDSDSPSTCLSFPSRAFCLDAMEETHLIGIVYIKYRD
jgi:hypothetical protein